MLTMGRANFDSCSAKITTSVWFVDSPFVETGIHLPPRRCQTLFKISVVFSYVVAPGKKRSNVTEVGEVGWQRQGVLSLSCGRSLPWRAMAAAILAGISENGGASILFNPDSAFH